MESLSPKNSNELLNNQDINEDINDIGLPKSSLQSFLKGFLSDKKIRGDKNIIPMLDKISRLYVYHLSSFGAKICTDCGKKTLNLEHIFEALKTMKFDEHIEKLVKDVKDNGSGHSYLIQHSAGSGKSNSIAWLAHRLSGLHDGKDEKIFQSVIVVTDRRVLDNQLQDTIYQFDHVEGVVQKILTTDYVRDQLKA
jgi:type I site-specific restriction-modification system R (restriction) subunit